MSPENGPLPSSNGSDVWALRLCRAYKGSPFRAHIKEPCNYPKIGGARTQARGLGFRV